MLERSILKSQAFGGPLVGQSTLKPKGNQGKRSLMFVLTLTSLIDAFTIIVIYLLVNFGNPSQELKMGLQLPEASRNDEISIGTTVSVNQGHYFIEDKEVSLSDLTKLFVGIVQSKSTDQNLIIQADKATDYDALSPVIMAGSQAGFNHFKFAVIQSAGGH
jgi:biopolymer transport protein ExbD